MNENDTYPTWPKDLRDPLGGIASRNPGAWALPATVMSWGSLLTAVFVLVWLQLAPWWRPPVPLDLVFAGLAAVVGTAVAKAGRSRPGPRLPRIWSLFVSVSSLAVVLGVLSGDPQLRQALGAPAFALLAAAGGLLPRLGRRRIGPLALHLQWIGVVGPLLGLSFAIVLRLIGGPAVNAWQVHSAYSEIQEARQIQQQICNQIQSLTDSNLEAAGRGDDEPALRAWRSLNQRLGNQPGPWPQPIGDASPPLCAEAAVALTALLRNGIPTPTSRSPADTGPVFAHHPRPERAGVLSPGLWRDPRATCELIADIHGVASGLISRLEAQDSHGRAPNRAVEELQQARTAWREKLHADWLDGWLAPCFVNEPEDRSDRLMSTLTRLTAPPTLAAGRADQWLDLSLRGADRIGRDERSCALRDEFHDVDRRRQVLDCALLSPEPRGAGPEKIQIVAEMAWIYSSERRKRTADPLPTIDPHRRPDALRLLIALPAGDPFFTEYRRIVDALIPSLERAGGRVVAPPGDDPGDSSAWTFEIGYGKRGVVFHASRSALPENRQALLLLARPAKQS